MEYYISYYIVGDSIEHHGILGQKWGVRRYQNEDGSYTSAGKKRRGQEGKKHKTLGNKTRTALKTVAIGAGLVGAGAVAWKLYRYKNTNLDETIPIGTTLQRMTSAKKEDYGTNMYATYKKYDNELFKNMYSDGGKNSDDHLYVKKMKTKDPIKIAGYNTLNKTYDEMMDNNPEFKEYCDALGMTNATKVIGSVMQDVDTWSDGDYQRLAKEDDFWSQLSVALYTPKTLFVKELKKKGYGGILDTHDSHSLNKAEKPVVVFADNVKKDIETKEVKEVTIDYMKTAGTKYDAEQLVRRTLLDDRTLAISTATAAIATSAVTYDNYRKKKYSTEDIKKNTKLMADNQVSIAKELRSQGLSINEIAKQMGVKPDTIRYSI